jgi:hypothetical protein
MPAEGQAPSIDLLEIVDEINRIRSFVEVAWMAGASLMKDECNAIQEVLGVANERLTAVRDKLDAARGASVEGDAHV